MSGSGGEQELVLSGVERVSMKRNAAIIAVVVLVIGYLMFRPHMRLVYTEYSVTSQGGQSRTTRVSFYLSRPQCDQDVAARTGAVPIIATSSIAKQRLLKVIQSLSSSSPPPAVITGFCKPEYKLMWGW